METLQEKIEKSFKENSPRIAIKIGEKNTTYSELYNEVKILSFSISNVWPEQRKYLLVWCDEIENTIKALLACLLSNNIAIPISKDYTEERIQHLQETYNIDGILVDRDKKNGLKNIRFLNMLQPMSIKKVELIYKYNLEDAIYVYFTSGSSGIPKAIIGKNKGLVHFIEWEINKFNIKPGDLFGQVTAPSFDPFLRDVFASLLSGSTLVLRIKEQLIYSPRTFYQWIKKNQITIIHCTPSLIKLMCSNEAYIKYKADTTSLRALLLAGEKIYPEYLENWNKYFDKKIKFWNLYGPTETTLAKCYYEIQRNKNYSKIIPVGQALPDTRIWILDSNGIPCKREEKGEIYIETEYMSLGYWNSKLNEGKFWKKIIDGKERLFYRTGDYGYKNREGEYVVVGRKDRQIKIDGIRVELDAIESLIRKYSGVKECAVIYDGESIISLIVSIRKISHIELREYLRKYIHKACIPKKIVFLDEIPLNENGKINYRLLKESHTQKSEVEIS